MEILSCFNSDFTSNPHSQYIDTILILWLPRDFGHTQSSVRDGFKVHVSALRKNLLIGLSRNTCNHSHCMQECLACSAKTQLFLQWFLQRMQINSWSYFIAVYITVYCITGGIAFLCSFLLVNALLKAMGRLFKFFILN